MRSAPFAYHAPSSVEEAVRLLNAGEGEARVLAGGQSLIPLLTMRLARPNRLVDINRVAGLSSIREDDGWLVLGALVRHHEVETSPVVVAACPMLASAAALVGDRQVRSRGTIGGSLAHADAAAELPTAVLALDGEIVAVGAGGRRTIAAARFFRGHLETALAPGELLTEVRVPVRRPDEGWSFHELDFKPSGFAVAACAAIVRVDAGGRCGRAAIALAGVAPAPTRIAAAEEQLVGRELTDDAIARAADVVFEAVDPEGDVHAPAAYRRAMARLCARRALAEAVACSRR